MKQRKQPARYKLTLGKGLYCGDNICNFGPCIRNNGLCCGSRLHGENEQDAKNAKRKRHRPMKANKKPEKSSYAGNWIGLGLALGALFFVLTSEPVWIAIGIAVGVALDWKRLKNKE